jgi:hypothetical protein
MKPRGDPGKEKRDKIIDKAIKSKEPKGYKQKGRGDSTKAVHKKYGKGGANKDDLNTL